MYSKKIKIKNINWLEKPQKFPALLNVRARYRAPLKKAKIDKQGNLIFAKPDRALTQGQSAVFYKDQHLVGGGTIDNVL